MLGRPAARRQHCSCRGCRTFDETSRRYADIDLEYFSALGAPIDGELEAMVSYPTDEHIVPAIAQPAKGHVTIAVC